MKYGRDLAIRFVSSLLLLVLPLPSLGQSKAPTLKEQLEAQFTPETVLVVQKDGILGLAPIIVKSCAANYQNGKFTPSDASCSAPIKDSSRMLAVGEKVHPRQVQVDLGKETISLGIVECESCNSGIPAPAYKAQIDFHFAKGYLEKGSVAEIEDTIAELLPMGSNEEQHTQTSQEANHLLTNEDVVKMATAKLGDGIIISAIKSDPCCNFDTSVNGMVSLKKAGVSDSVIQAMRDAETAANSATNASATPSATETQAQPEALPSVPGQLSFSVRHRHSAFLDFSHPNNVEFYCYGTLLVSPDGTVTYDCERTDDPSGRCEHVSFAPGSLKVAKMGYAGALHLESLDKKQGKFDFYGNSRELKQALEKITPHMQN
jgi:hypothetical protein